MTNTSHQVVSTFAAQDTKDFGKVRLGGASINVANPKLPVRSPAGANV
jgi:hypothetical protein